jgi:NADPH:quinone reductase-like Zn-dependent oxidoreductase
VIIDNVANRTLSENRRVLTPNGRYVLIGGGSANEQGFFGALRLPLKAFVYSKFVNQKMGMMMAQPSTQDLSTLAEMVQSGKLKTVIDRTYKSLSEVPDAIRYVEEGHARGKVIILVD